MSGCGTLLPDVAQSGPDLNVRRRSPHDLFVALHPEGDSVVPGPAVDVLDRKAALDFGLARLVRGAVVALFGAGIVAPIPLDGGAVELLEVVGAAGQFRCEDNARRRHGDNRLR